jgi:endoglucanase
VAAKRVIRLLATFFLAATCLQACASTRKAELMDDGWSRYLKEFVVDGRVLDTGNNGISHSEGQGWGMLLAEANGDRRAFDSLWAWTKTHLQRTDVALFSWRYDPSASPPVQDPNNATDGDLLIAWALMRAASHWQEPRYEEASARIRAAIADNLMRSYAGRTVLLPGITGFERGEEVVLNPSYLVAPALLAFAEREPKAGWEKVLDDGLWIVEQARFGTYHLPPDWLALKPDGTVGPAQGWAPRFGFDAVRVPLYLVWAGLSPLGPLFEPFKTFWQCCEPPHAWIDLKTGEVSPYPASTGVRAIAALLENDQTLPVATEIEDYYSFSLLQLARMARERH